MKEYKSDQHKTFHQQQWRLEDTGFSIWWTAAHDFSGASNIPTHSNSLRKVAKAYQKLTCHPSLHTCSSFRGPILMKGITFYLVTQAGAIQNTSLNSTVQRNANSYSFYLLKISPIIYSSSLSAQLFSFGLLR